MESRQAHATRWADGLSNAIQAVEGKLLVLGRREVDKVKTVMHFAVVGMAALVSIKYGVPWPIALFILAVGGYVGYMDGMDQGIDTTVKWFANHAENKKDE